MAKARGTTFRFYENTGPVDTPVYTALDCEGTVTLSINHDTEEDMDREKLFEAVKLIKEYCRDQHGCSCCSNCLFGVGDGFCGLLGEDNDLCPEDWTIPSEEKTITMTESELTKRIQDEIAKITHKVEKK